MDALHSNHVDRYWWLPCTVTTEMILYIRMCMLSMVTISCRQVAILYRARYIGYELSRMMSIPGTYIKQLSLNCNAYIKRLRSYPSQIRMHLPLRVLHFAILCSSGRTNPTFVAIVESSVAAASQEGHASRDYARIETRARERGIRDKSHTKLQCTCTKIHTLQRIFRASGSKLQ